jgi:glycosyltransferase involved in cell wall biosynthesis
MRIALVTETFVPEINGVARTLERLVNELGKRGHQLHIVRPRQQQAPEQHGDEPLAHFPFPQTLVAGLPIPGYSGLQFGLPAGRKLAKLWQRQAPDVIYVATEGPLGASAINTARRLGIPVVSGFHTNFHSYSRHYRLGWLERFIFIYLRNLHNKTCCTLAPSPELVDQLRQRGINDAELFSRGVDTDIFDPRHRDPTLRERWKVPPRAPVALYVGRIAAEKNIQLVIDSYRAMQDKQPALRLVMVGDGPLLGKLKKQHPDIIFSGPKVGHELSAHYASADIFLFASVTETFGNVILEAMSSGLAVVAYDYAAASMHINHGHNGLAVAMGDQQQFCNTAVHLIQQPETIESLRKQARVSAQQADWTHVIDHFEKVLVRYVKSQSPHKRKSEQPVSADGQA